jgi:hypothetical protein
LFRRLCDFFLIGVNCEVAIFQSFDPDMDIIQQDSQENLVPDEVDNLTF